MEKQDEVLNLVLPILVKKSNWAIKYTTEEIEKEKRGDTQVDYKIVEG